MSQPLLIAFLAVAIAIGITALIALIASDAQYTARAIKLTLIGGVMAIVIVAIDHAHLRFNFTQSMPIGIYALRPLPESVRRGMIVAACAPARAAEIGLRRRYIARGPCANGAELLLKSVAAIAGDQVAVTAVGVAVNGCLLTRSRPLTRDRSGRRLISWPRGHHRLTPDEIWLYAADNRSWDSRYWGPASLADIKAEASPLVVLSGGFHASSGWPDCKAGSD